MKKYRVVLASGSPRRKELLERIGVTFDIIKSDKEEDMSGSDPCEVVRRLSAMKAEDVAASVEGPAIVIGSDTVVAFEGRILGKPHSEEEAFEMLSQLRDNTHHVHTGVCIVIKGEQDETELSFDVTTGVSVTPVSDEKLREYIATGEPMDKAGAYAIQGRFGVFVSGIEGDYNNVVGFPLSAIYNTLLDEGIDLCNPVYCEE